MNNEPVQVLVITFNRLRYLKQCIGFLKKQTYPIVINIWDNGSKDGTKEWIEKNLVGKEEKLGLFFDNSINIGTANARNYGFAKIPTKMIMMCDDDMWFEKSWIEKCVEIYNGLNNDKYHIGVIGNYMPFTGEYYKKRILCKEFRWNNYLLHEITGAPPGCWFCDKEAILSVGGFRLKSKYLMGFSASNLPNRMRKIGYRSIRLLKYNNEIYKGVQHTDNLKHPYNHWKYYEQVGYNAFRKQQKCRKSKRKK